MENVDLQALVKDMKGGSFHSFRKFCMFGFERLEKGIKAMIYEEQYKYNCPYLRENFKEIGDTPHLYKEIKAFLILTMRDEVKYK